MLILLSIAITSAWACAPVFPVYPGGFRGLQPTYFLGGFGKNAVFLPFKTFKAKNYQCDIAANRMGFRGFRTNHVCCDKAEAKLIAAQYQGWSPASIADIWTALPSSVTANIGLTEEQIKAMIQSGANFAEVVMVTLEYMRKQGVTPYDVLAVFQEHCPQTYSKYFAPGLPVF